MTNWQRKRYPKSRGEMEAGKKTEIAMGDCIRSDIERVGENLEKMIERRNRKLLTVRGRKKDNGKGNHGQLIPGNSDAKKIITTKCNLTFG